MAALLNRRWIVLILALWLSPPPCPAHPDLIEEIARTSAELKQSESSSLYLERADLFRRHGEFDAALADIGAAERTNHAVFNLDRARVLCDAGRAAESFEFIQTFLKSDPANAEALIIRARCQARLGHPEAAVADFTAGISRCPAPGPDLFLERAKQQAALGQLEEAVRGLDEAITNGTPLPSLQMAAIEYDRRRGAFDSALARADGFVARYPVKEPWLTLRAEILEQAGRGTEARQTFRQVLAGIERYSQLRRTLDLTKQLEARARQGLARTQGKPVASASP
jgi:predicted Zn-dependent protease